ncbi:MAG: hypothetical protein ACLFV3_04860 [Phycisphaeraceae bacterium]
MELTRERKILLAVLSLGLGALMLDRVVLNAGASGPKSATASGASYAVPEEAETPAEPSPKVDTAATPAADASAPALARRLAEVASQERADPTRTRDAFNPAAPWNAAPEAQRPDPAEEALRQFAGRHRLTAVMPGGEDPVAVVDGQLLRPGEKLDGLRLVAIAPGSATFERDGGQVRLELYPEGRANDGSVR